MNKIKWKKIDKMREINDISNQTTTCHFNEHFLSKIL